MTADDLIAFIRSKQTDHSWAFHGPSICDAVRSFEVDVRLDARTRSMILEHDHEQKSDDT